MKENNNIDSLFKEGLKQEFPYDENLWNALEQQLPVAPAKRSLWHFNLNSVILGVILFIYATIQSDTAKSTKVYSSAISNADSPVVTATAEIAQLNQSKAIYADDNNKLAKLDQSSENRTAFNQTTFPKHENVSAPNVGLNNTTKKKVNENLRTKKQAKAISKSNVKRSESTIATSPASFQSSNATSAIEQQGAGINNYPTQSIVLNNSANATQNDEISLYSNKSSIVDSKEKLPPFISMLSAGFKYESNAEASPKKGNNKERIMPKKKQYYLEFEASRSFDLEKKVSSTNSQFVDLKRQTEKSLHSVNLGINALTYYKFLTFGVGLHYNRFYENVNYTVDREANTFDISYDTNYVIVNQDFNSNGTPVILIREELTEIRTPRTIIVEDQLRVQNEFKRIRIPLSIGYEKAFGSWSAGLSTSFVINYLFQQDGVYINEDLNSINGFNEEEEFFLLVFGHQASAGVGYSLNEFIAIGARYQYEYDLNSFTRNYSSKFQSQNLGLWLRIRPR